MSKKDINEHRKNKDKKDSILNNSVKVEIFKNSIGCSRFAIVISKKDFKKAVYRNRIRRKIREHIRTILEKVPISIDVLIYTRMQNEIDKSSYSIINDIENMFSRLICLMHA